MYWLKLFSVKKRKRKMSLDFFFYRIGDGHCTYVEFPNGERGLIDLKITTDLDDPLQRLQNAGIRTIHYLWITHPHRDHITGLNALRENFTIGAFHYSGVNFTPNPPYNDWYVYEYLKSSFTNRFQSNASLYRQIGTVRLDYLAPPRNLLTNVEDEVNNNSLMLKFTYGSTRILICGDTGREGWEYIPDASIRNIDLLLASHHGNDNGYYRPKVETMNPRYVVISAGPRTPHDADQKYRYYARNDVYTTRTSRVVAKCESDGTINISQ